LDGIPETTVFLAERNGELVGSNSLTIDGPRQLHVDEDFPDQVKRIRLWSRSVGLRLGASWRIVTQPKIHGQTAVILRLIDATVRRGAELGLHVTLYSFNPKHERFYKRFLGLTTVARDICRAAQGAKAVLMIGDSRKIETAWKKLCLAREWPATGVDSPEWPRGIGSWR